MRNEIIDEMKELRIKREVFVDSIAEIDDRLWELGVDLEKYDHNAEIIERLEEIQDTIYNLEIALSNHYRGRIAEQLKDLVEQYEELARELDD